ncbi:MAG: glucose-6-phosphate isomerase [Tissierellia bacterium]|nr:glucose-6-phosphate isomerase [Tissierellia bacterium]
MDNISLDYSKALVEEHELKNIWPYVKTAHDLLHKKAGPGREYTGWLDLTNSIDRDEIKRLKTVSRYIRENTDIFISIGVGGSYLGARACIEALNHNFYNALPGDRRKGPQIYFVGNNLSSSYMLDLLDLLEGKDLAISVISKSGTTMEPALAFRIFRQYMINRYGHEEAKKRIYIITDKSKGILRSLAQREGYTSFTIPEDIGGRYSVLTPVGLLPMAVAGIDIDEILQGALDGAEEYSKDTGENISYKYAALRNILYKRGKYIEILAHYEPNLHYFAEWWKQLFGESEGKDKKGIYPSSVSFTEDLHSLGQLIQDGRRNIFETTINILNPRRDLVIEEDEEDLDGLNYLAGKTIDYVNKKAFEGTLLAHFEGGVPSIVINIPHMKEYYLGKLIYFFEKACAISGYLLGVNPFNQPGVEEYKKNMFRLLGK